LNSLRIGCVKYVNARPLIRGWPRDVAFDHPSVLCQRLANRELDVALVSSFEYLRNPVYRIVDGASISSDGPVYSVVVAYSGNISEIEEIELDPASETSANLLRCLLAELGLTPCLSWNIGFQPVCPAGLQPAVSAAVQPTESKTAENISAGRTGKMPMFQAPPRARLLIGDQAIHFRQKHAGEFQFWDLGEQWKKLTGLPFVYALWLIRPEVTDPKSIAHRLRKLRDKNLVSLGDLIEEIVADVGTSAVASAKADKAGPWKELNREFLLGYFRKHLRFSFGKKEKQGLQRFADLCATHGVLPARDRPFTVV
jgi:predicted solute-binding protein